MSRGRASPRTVDAIRPSNGHVVGIRSCWQRSMSSLVPSLVVAQSTIMDDRRDVGALFHAEIDPTVDTLAARVTPIASAAAHRPNARLIWSTNRPIAIKSNLG